MKIYLVVIDDTHADIDVIPFYSKEKAIQYAKDIVERNCSSLEDLEEEVIEGWLFFCNYTPESFIFVIEKEIM